MSTRHTIKICKIRFPGLGRAGEIQNNAARFCLAFIGLLWLGVLALRAADRYVVEPGTPGGTNTPPYTAWNIAATQIQWAVTAATNVNDTVWVSNGTYNLTNQITLTNAIILKSVNGTNFTFVNGNYPAYTNRCFYVNSNDSIIDGFTITNGFLSSTNQYDGGGCVYLYYKGTIRNCIIQGNVSTNASHWSNGGGGIYLYYGGTVSNCVIFSNTTQCVDYNVYGGGIFLVGDSALIRDSLIISNTSRSTGGAHLRSGAVISNCVVAGNSASDYYGGIVISGGSRGFNCTVYNNRARSEFGGVLLSGSTMRDSVISNNTAKYGGGVGINPGVSSSCLISNCVITGNSATNSGARQGGGGLYSYEGANSIVTIVNCVIYANRSDTNGGGVHCRGGDVTIAILRNCLIYNNTNLSDKGGGIYMESNMFNGAIQNCTIVSNQAGTLGGGIYLKAGTNRIENCIIYGNVATNDASDEVFNDPAGNSNAYYYCCAPTNLAPNQGNITNDPRFADPVSGNWRLSQNSPCINRGTNVNWMTNSYDLDGRARIRYGTVDMGAYERIYDGAIYSFR